MFLEALKAAFIGIVEGITEWLPISSTGHMIIVDEFVELDVTLQFLELFLVVIQIGAILAVIILYFSKLNPFSRKKTPVQKRATWRLWSRVVVGCIPAAVIFVIADDWVTENFYNAVTVSIMLIAYGIVFIILERRNRKRQAALAASGVLPARSSVNVGGKHIKDPQTGQLVRQNAKAINADDAEQEQEQEQDGIFKINTVDEIDWKTALKIGLFQMLAIVPGTSRSGSTIIGGMLCGVSRSAATEFTFFLAIPVMLGWGLIRSVQYFLDGMVMTQTEIVVLVVGIAVAFVTSVIAIKFLMGYIKKNDFTAFGWYRIIIGVVLLAFFGFTGALFVTQ